MSKNRNWCFTLNNYTKEEETHLTEIGNNIETKKITYLVFGKEIGHKSGVPHLQGYVEFSGQKRLNEVSNVIGKRAHLEIRKGTALEAAKYCKKDGIFLEFGKLKEQGKRNDLNRTVEKIKSGASMRDIMNENGINFQQVKLAEKALTYCGKKRENKTFVCWLYGTTGSGKSTTARLFAKNLGFTKEDFYTKNNGSKWWDGYDNHKVVILDDFRDSWFEYTELLSLLDRYEKTVEIKGGTREFVPEVLIITSIYKPTDCYSTSIEPIEQLLRRIEVIQEVITNSPENIVSKDELEKEKLKTQKFKEILNNTIKIGNLTCEAFASEVASEVGTSKMGVLD